MKIDLWKFRSIFCKDCFYDLLMIIVKLRQTENYLWVNMKWQFSELLINLIQEIDCISSWWFSLKMLICIMWWYKAHIMRWVSLHMLSVENKFHRRIIETSDLRQSFINDRLRKFRLCKTSTEICWTVLEFFSFSLKTISLTERYSHTSLSI